MHYLDRCISASTLNTFLE